MYQSIEISQQGLVCPSRQFTRGREKKRPVSRTHEKSRGRWVERVNSPHCGPGPRSSTPPNSGLYAGEHKEVPDSGRHSLCFAELPPSGLARGRSGPAALTDNFPNPYRLRIISMKRRSRLAKDNAKSCSSLLSLSASSCLVLPSFLHDTKYIIRECKKRESSPHIVH
jgi:hypothetical protein